MNRLILKSLPIVLGMIFSFLATAIVARLVGPAVFGDYIFFLTWISVAALISKSGHEWVLLKILPGRIKEGSVGQIFYILKKAFTAVILRACFSAAVLGSLAFFSGHWSRPGSVALSLGLVIVLAISELRRSWALAYQATWFSDAPENIAKSILLAGAVYIFTILGLEVSSYNLLIINIVATLGTAILASWLFITFYEPNILKTKSEKFNEKNADVKGVVNAMSFSTLANISIRNLDLMILGLVVDANSVGYYAAASRIALLAAGPIMVLDRVIAPGIAEAAESKNFLKTNIIVKRFIILAVSGAIFILLTFVSFGDYLINTIFGREYNESIMIAIMIMIGNLVAALAGPAGVVMILGGAHSQSAMISITTAMTNLTLLLVLIPLYGVFGAAIATGASISIKAIASAFMVQRCLGVNTSITIFFKNK